MKLLLELQVTCLPEPEGEAPWPNVCFHGQKFSENVFSCTKVIYMYRDMFLKLPAGECMSLGGLDEMTLCESSDVLH